MHNILLMLLIYTTFIFFINKKERTLTNILLFTIVISIDTLIHQIINIINNNKTNYL